MNADEKVDSADDKRPPVFVDETGRRRRWLRWVGLLVGVGALAYVVMIVVSLLGGPVSPHTLLPIAGVPTAVGRAGSQPDTIQATSLPEPNAGAALFVTGSPTPPLVVPTPRPSSAPTPLPTQPPVRTSAPTPATTGNPKPSPVPTGGASSSPAQPPPASGASSSPAQPPPAGGNPQPTSQPGSSNPQTPSQPPPTGGAQPSP